MSGLALERFLAHFPEQTPDGKGHRVLCPAHNDHDPSLYVQDAGDKLLITCRAGCDTSHVLELAGIPMRELFESYWHYNGDQPKGAQEGSVKGKKPPFGKIKDVYDYENLDGTLAYQSLRDEHKNFRLRRPKPGHRDPGEPMAWINNIDGVTPLLFKLPEISFAVSRGLRIYVVEGEKDVLTLRNLGLVATTNHGGAGKWGDAHSDQIKGAREVVILPDNDDPGRKHARDVRRAISGKVDRVKILELSGLPPKGDASDWIAQGHTKEELEALADNPPLPEGWASALQLMETDMPETEWIIPNIISLGATAILSGEDGVWKSWTCLHMALCLATGTKFLSHFPTGESKVLLVNGDESEQDTRKKLRWLYTGAGMNGSQSPLINKNFYLRSDFFQLTNDDELERLCDVVGSFGPKLVIIDNLNSTIEGEENKADFARAIRKISHAVRAAHHCTVLFIHHWTKPSKERENTPKSRLRGSGGIRGAAAHHISIERTPEDVAIFTVDKNRSGRELAPFTFVPRIVESEGMAYLQYEGDSEDKTATTGCTKAIVELLETDPQRPWTKPEVVAILTDRSRPERYAARSITRAIYTLERSRILLVTPSKGGKPTLVQLRSTAGDQQEIKSTRTPRHNQDMKNVSRSKTLPKGDLD